MARGNPNIAAAQVLAWKSPNIGKHGKSFATIAKEKARDLYILKMMQDFDGIMKVHIEEALKPENIAERIHAITQVVGKPTENVNLHGDFNVVSDL